MAVPKRKTSKMRKRQRIAAQRARVKYPQPSASTAGGADFHLPHRVCPTTGMYRGRQVLVVSTDED